MNDAVSLNDKWTLDQGRVLINGTQAMARVLLAQSALDAAAGLNTAGYVSGYRGSPLGNFDTALWAIGDRLTAANILFAPGVNEDIAATAVRGTQQLGSVPDPRFDGVFAAWYGKGPGVDRSLDALKHGNYGGAHRHGGVLVFYGDDHGGKSSTVSHHSEQAMAAALIPSLYPADVGEIVEYGLLAYAMSRFSGSWVGMKLVNEVAEQTATVDINVPDFRAVLPEPANLPPEGVHARTNSFMPLREEQIVSEHRLPLVHQFVRANGIDRTAFRAKTPRLALVTAGKSYSDTRQALDLLGLNDARASALGISLYKVGCIWPLEPTGLVAFADGHDTVFVIEEKKSFLETQAAQSLFNVADRPLLIGKSDEDGNPLLSATAQLEPLRIALAIAGRLSRLGIRHSLVEAAGIELQQRLQPSGAVPAQAPRRTPYFCSGCPHNRSTRVPEGSLSMTGIGCHAMVAFARPAQALLPTHMGGEGGNWMGLAPFTGTKHIFQNMGDGTYYHSGLLAIRAAVASKVNITYKILYNDAVAMTGGQPVDGPISVAEIAQQVRHEGVKAIMLVSDNPDAHRGNPALPSDISIHHRDELDAVQRTLREVAGCSVLIYEQTCAAEKRRRRKRGLYPDPPKRMFISKAVCEGCGDCSVQSTCVSLTPVETDFGVKRRIDQSSCNKDYSCLNGFCPSFITVQDGEPRKPKAAQLSPALFDGLAEPPIAPLDDSSFNLLVTGVGGTGVITVAAILGMAAHLEGLAASLFDMTGLAQKNGAVFSHVRIAASPDHLHAQRLGRGEADVILAFDLVAALSDEATLTMTAGRTHALVNSDVVPTVAFQFNRDATIDNRLLLARLHRLIGEETTETLDAATLSTLLLGNSIGSNLFLTGVASQRGMLPVSPSAIEQAVRLNATAVDFNLSAFRLGRLYAADAARVEGLLPSISEPLPQGLDALIERRVTHLTHYQNEAYAQRYRGLVEQVRVAEQKVALGRESLTATVARAYARILAYKDEYEVARLLTDPALEAELRENFADGARFSFNLAAPIIAGKSVNGRPGKRAFKMETLKPVLKLLARAKGLRGTAFDPFGRNLERRNERALISDYEALVRNTLELLTPHNLDAADALLGLVDVVRGYGPVKEAALALYKQQLPGAQKTFGTSETVKTTGTEQRLSARDRP